MIAEDKAMQMFHDACNNIRLWFEVEKKKQEKLHGPTSQVLGEQS